MAFDKVIDSAQLNANLESVADAIRDKGNTTEKLSFPAGMVSAIGDIKTKESVTWNQCPPLVKAFLDEVTYDPTDYSTSQIASYAPATADASNTKPVGKTVGGKTFYNEEPNKETPFATETTAGTLKPLDRLRWIKTTANNVRDLGGWDCDGGTVKYGMLFRGGICTSNDRIVLVEELGVKNELDLIYDYPENSSRLGSDINYFCTENSIQYSISNTETWKDCLRFLLDSVKRNSPVYIHCIHGADRTGSFVCVLEGLLGVSQSDIDKDYEISSFYSGTDTDEHKRARNENDWIGFINQINDKTGSTFRDKCVTFLIELGFTIDEINDFRKSMINGSPEELTYSLPNYSISATLEQSVLDNEIATDFQPFEANITPNSGYIIDEINITMGEVDISEKVISGIAVNSGTKSIIENGIHNVSGFENVKVNVPSQIPEAYTGTYDFSSSAASITIDSGKTSASTIFIFRTDYDYSSSEIFQLTFVNGKGTCLRYSASSHTIGTTDTEHTSIKIEASVSDGVFTFNVSSIDILTGSWRWIAY